MRLLILLLLPTSLLAAPVDYAREVKPLLQERCYACHGALKQNAKLRLDSGELIRKGGKSGPAAIVGKSASSPLIERVSDMDEHSRMPPEGLPLKPEQIKTLKAWIDEGAIVPADDKPELDPRDHWAFRVPVKVPVPKVEPAWGKNAIDAFIAAEWKKHGLAPQEPADKRILLRRLYIDLTGLPPTAEQYDAFLKDTSTNAYEKVADQLLESPQYGERWGRHLMDIYRYSDWWGLGAEVRNSQKHIWHWRDWIVESLNADKGYDQMVREMLAADELYPTDTNKLRASGYLARQYFIFNRTTWLDETVEHTAKSFLGLTMNCTKCHDHKYDPIAHADYYKFRAFFEPYQVRTDMVPGESDFEKNGLPRAFDCNLEALTYRHERGDDRKPITSQKILPGLPSVLGTDLKIEPVSLPREAHSPHLLPFVEENYLAAAQKRIEAAKDALAKAKAVKVDIVKTEPEASAKEKRPEPEVSARAKTLVKDDFTKEKPELWDVGPGKWKYEKGLLTQSIPGPERSQIRLKTKVPTDFEAKFKFTWTGGEPWRSIGLCFDVAGENEAMVYASTVSGGEKVQISFKQGTAQVYPPEGFQARPFKVGDTCELTVRVRGPVMNVDVNGEHSLSFRLPIPRKAGAIELITFAATAEFRAFELNELPASYKLVEPKSPKNQKGPIAKPTSPEQVRFALVVAEKELAAAEAVVPGIRAQFAAERGRFASPPTPGLAKIAAKAEKQIALLKAEVELAKAELEIAQAGTPQKLAAEKKRDAARTAVAAATKAVESPGEAYTRPPGSRKTKENNLEGEPSLSKPFPITSTGRRSALAKWITDRQNPLAARVIVNHVWARHFGKPLAATVFNLGRNGAKPTHPELLDWLAVEFMEHGWSLKHLHRLMVTSQVYQLSSSVAGAEKANGIDEANRFYWRTNPMRMEAQAVRDSLLMLSGQLDLTRGGPSLDVNAQADSKRRSLYFVHSHNDHHKFLMQFDDAGVLECYRRTESIVPQQALTMANSKFSLTMADAIAARIGSKSDAEFVHAAFALILASTPSADEKQACLEALAEWQKLLREQKHADPGKKARENLVGALLNHNDFVTVR